jgi:hypothetical protein
VTKSPVLWLLLFSVAGCGGSTTNTAHRSRATPPRSTGSAPADAPAPEGPPAFCSNAIDDTIHDVFCGADPPVITSVADVEAQLHVITNPFATPIVGLPPVLLGHSTSLSGHLVSPINPRLMAVNDDSTVAFAFTRGVQRVEIAARTHDLSSVAFYLFTFRQACNDTSAGCTPGDLYTPAVESDWTSVRIDDDEALKNTPLDCRQCHQRGREHGVFLMRELEQPWTHFLAAEGDPNDPGYRYGINGGLLTTEFRSARGDESYGGIASSVVQSTTPAALESQADLLQPLLFDSGVIENERFPQMSDWPGPPQRSATWDSEYAAFKRGEHLPLPYFDAHATDPEKLANLSDAYARFRSGDLAAAELPDLADIFPDDPQTRAEIGLQVEPEATPVQTLVQACGTCHNDVLDQSISRAKFNVDVSKLPAPEVEQAIQRLTLASDDPRIMPPAEARALTPDVRARLVDYLRAASYSEADRAFLSHAAAAGMAGPTQDQAKGDGPPPAAD